MHSAIIWVKRSETTDQKWFAFAESVAKEKGILPYVQAMSENVWMVDFQAGPIALAIIVAFAEKQGIPYAILALAEKPQWLPAGQSLPTKVIRNGDPYDSSKEGAGTDVLTL